MKAVLEAAGADVSESRVKALIAALEGVDLDQIVGSAQPEIPDDGAAAAEIEGGTVDGEVDLPEPTDEESDDSGGSLSNIFGGDSN